MIQTPLSVPTPLPVPDARLDHRGPAKSLTGALRRLLRCTPPAGIPQHPAQSRSTGAVEVPQQRAEPARRALALPAPPPTVDPAWEPDEALTELLALVDDLAARGAFDEHHGDAMDPLVDRLVAVWRTGRSRTARALREHLAELRLVETALADARDLAHDRYKCADDELSAVDAELVRLVTTLDGIADDRPTFRRARRVASTRRDLPLYSSVPKRTDHLEDDDEQR